MSDAGNITICRTDGGYLVRVAPRGTVHESPALQNFVCRALDEGVDIILDLSDCEYLDSTFQGCLVIVHQRGETSLGSFGVFADEAVRRRLFATCQLDVLLSFVRHGPPPVSQFVSLPSASLDRAALCEHLIATHAKLADLGGPDAEVFQRIAQQLRNERHRL